MINWRPKQIYTPKRLTLHATHKTPTQTANKQTHKHTRTHKHVIKEMKSLHNAEARKRHGFHLSTSWIYMSKYAVEAVRLVLVTFRVGLINYMVNVTSFQPKSIEYLTAKLSMESKSRRESYASSFHSYQLQLVTDKCRLQCGQESIVWW